MDWEVFDLYKKNSVSVAILSLKAVMEPCSKDSMTTW